MKNKLICFVNASRQWGGGEKWHYSMAKSLHEDGYSVCVFAHRNSLLYHKCKEANIEVIPFSIGNLSFLNPFKHLYFRSMLKKINPEFLVLNSPRELKFSGLSAYYTGYKNIIYRRGIAVPIKNTILNRYLLRKVCKGIIANSKMTKETILSKNKNIVPPAKIKVIYNGLNIKNFDPKEFIQSDLKAEYQGIVIGNASRLVKQKGHEHLIDLAIMLKKRGVSFKLVIAGQGKLEKLLKEKVRSTGLTDEIVFSGFIENIKSYLNSIDIYVSTSLWEGFGFSLVEAMAMEKPVVAFNLSSNSEVIENEVSGFLVQDVQAMADKLEILYENSALRKQMGLAGRNRAIKLFSLESSKHKLLTYLNEL